jgi:DNA-binding NarL/FixJ family response regulator
MTEQRNGRGVLRLVSGDGDRGRPAEGGGARPDDRPVKLLIGHAHRFVRAGFRLWLESEDWIEVVAEASNCDETIELAAESYPDVALIDLGLAGLDDPKGAVRTIAQPALADVAVILVAPEDSDGWVYDGLSAGAVGVVERDVGPRELIFAVQVVARGGALVPALIVRRLLGLLPAQPPLRRPASGRLGELTAREREIVPLVARGLSNNEIAALLVVSPKTVKTHVSRAMGKLGARHRAQLVVFAYEMGLVSPPLEGAMFGVDEHLRAPDGRARPAGD